MLSFGDAVRRFYSRYVDFEGRSQRSEYWWFYLYFYAVLVAIVIVGLLLGFDIESLENDEMSGVDAAVIASGALWFFGHALGMIALAVRRFHDLGQTGWLVLVFGIIGIIPIIGSIASLAQTIWFIFPGTHGPNRYGPDPLGGDYEPIFEPTDI